MKKYIFETKARMKDYNCDNYWIDEKFVPQFVVNTENLPEAINKYQEFTKTHFAVISDNAKRTKKPIYRDTKDGAKQVGYVFTAKTDIDDTQQYIDLWATIYQLVDCF